MKLLNSLQAAAIILAVVAARAAADTLTWDANGAVPPSGTFNVAANWDPDQVPLVGDTTIFNAAQTYVVTFTADQFSDVLNVTAGNVSFRSSSATQRLYRLTTGGSDATVNGGATLNVGATTLPIDLFLGDTLTIGNSGGGTLNVSGASSSLVVAGGGVHTIGSISFAGTLSYSNASTGAISGTLLIGNGLSGTASGTLSVQGNADLDVGNLQIANAAIGVPTGTGTVTVSGVGSTLDLTGAATLTVGDDSTSVGIVNVNTSGVFTTGTGAINVHPTGQINIGGGTLNLNGNTTINGGSLTKTSGTLALANGTTLTIQNGGEVNLTGTQTIGGANVAVDGGAANLTITGTTTLGQAGNSAFLSFLGGAPGALAGLNLATDSSNNTLGEVQVFGGSTVTVSGDINAATTAGFTGQTGQIHVLGTLMQTGAAGITLGNAGIGAGSTGRIELSGGTATFNSGAGTINVNNGGVIAIVDVGDVFYADGNVTVDGGRIEGEGQFSVRPNVAATVLVAGVVDVRGMSLADGSQLSVEGGQLNVNQATLNAAVLDFNNGSAASRVIQLTANDNSQVDWTSNSSLRISDWTFRDGSELNVTGAIRLESEADAELLIESGARATTGTVHLGTVEGDLFTSYSATITIQGAGSQLVLADGADLDAGVYTFGTATLNVDNGGLFRVGVGGVATLRTRATININGGAVDLKTLDDQGGTINFLAGSLSYIGDLAVGIGGLLGTDLTLASNRHLTLTGTTTIDASRTLIISGGSFSTGSLVANGTFDFQSGTLSVTGLGGLAIVPGGLFGSSLTLGADKTLIVTNTATVEASHSLTLDGGSLSVGELVVNGSFDFVSGTLAVTGPGGLTIGSGGLLGAVVALGPNRMLSVANTTTISSGAQLVLQSGADFSSGALDNSGLVRGDGMIRATLNNNTGGEVRVATGQQLQLVGAGNVNSGQINLLGGTVEFTQDLANDDDGLIIGQGSLLSGGLTNSGTMAFSGAANVLGDVENTADGLVISSGGGPTTFFDDVVNNGEIRTSPGSFTVFFGALNGAGAFTGTGTVNVEGPFSPGSSPAIVQFDGSLVLGPAATTMMELGGTNPGTDYDQLQVAGDLDFGGTLNVEMISGFAPAAGDSFDLFDWGMASGTFSTLDLPALSGDLMWNASQLYSVGVLSVSLLGDYNSNGIVDAADYTIWRDSLGQVGSGLAADGNLDGTVTQLDYDVWRLHFGESAEVGSAGTVFVPEPGCLTLAFCVLVSVAHALVSRRRISDT